MSSGRHSSSRVLIACTCLVAGCTVKNVDHEDTGSEDASIVEAGIQDSSAPSREGAIGCPTGRTLCAGKCVDTTLDPKFCRDCNTHCQSGEVCKNSSCQLAGDCRQTPCTGLSYCDLSTGICKPGCGDASKCGANESCDVATHTCVCVAGFHQCSGSCVSNSSTATCGNRCQPCPTDPHGTASCDGKTCGLQCIGGYSACGSVCCPDIGSVCKSNACVPGCELDTECAANEYCNKQTATCTVGCRTNVSCTTAGTWCDWSAGHVCADCVDKSYEPNETESTASSFTAPLGQKTSWNFSICGNGDVDYLSIKVMANQGTSWEVILEDLTSFSSTVTIGWKSDYWHEEDDYSGGGPTTIISSKVTSCYSPCPETYLFKVTGLGSPKPINYRLTVNSW